MAARTVKVLPIAQPGSKVSRDSPRQQTPEFFQTTLYPPQAAMLHRMMTMEATQRMRLKHGQAYQAAYHLPGSEMVYDAAFLDAPFGFGKTLIVCALVASEVMPAVHTVMVNLMTQFGKDANRYLVFSDEVTPSTFSARGLFGRRLTGADVKAYISGHDLHTELEWAPERMIRSTLVVVPTSILGQWEEMIRRYAPHLNIFVVRGAQELRDYRAIFESGRSGEFHAVLIRAGTISVDTDIWGRGLHDGFETGVRRSIPTVTAIALLTHNVVWQRVVVDDFDTMKISPSAQMPPAHFTWYVSATARATLVKNSTARVGNIREVGQGLWPGTWPFLGVCIDQVMRSQLTVQCESDFATENCRLPAPVFHRAIVKAPASVQMFRGLNLAPGVYEALNSGDAKAAGKEMGIYCSNMTDLLLALVKRNKAAIVQEEARCELLKRVLELLSLDPEWLDRVHKDPTDPPPTGTGQMKLSAKRAEKLLIEVRKDLPAEVVLRCTDLYPNAVGTLAPGAATNIATYYTKIRNIAGGAHKLLDRIRENSQEGACQVCLLDWEPDMPRYITRCCQMMLCNVCVLDPATKNLIAKCPNPSCGNALQGNLLMLDSDLNFDGDAFDLIDEELEPKPKSKPVRRGALAKDPTEDEIKEIEKAFNGDEKIGTLIRLITGIRMESEKDPWSAQLHNVMGIDGDIIPLPADAPQRILVFAVQSGSLTRISRALSRARIDHIRLAGNHKAMNVSIAAFRGSKRPREVMLITGNRDCAGIHLPETTMEIFMHRIASPDIGAQLVGRGQRAGRRTSMEVFTLCYEGMEE